MYPKYLKILICWLMGILMGSATVMAQYIPFEHGRPEVYFRFPMPPGGLDSLNNFLSVGTVRMDSVYAYANQNGFNVFLMHGIPYEVLIPPSMVYAPLLMMDDLMAKGVQTWNYYPTYTGYETLMAGFEQQYPDLCRLHNLGTLTSGRKILALRITKYPDSLQAKPAFLYSATMHGDEVVGYVLMLRLADYLLSNYGLNPAITRLVDSLDIWISPLANPNGTYSAGNHTIGGATRFNASGIDLNRNFPCPQYGPNPINQAWQQETIIYMGFAQARGFSMGANIHGGAEVCNYPWDVWSRLHPDNNWWTHVCRQYADTAQYYSPSTYMIGFNSGITNGYAWYSISGGRQDYMNYFHQCREFTLEISNPKAPPASTLNSYWNYNYRSLLNYLGQALNGLHGRVYDTITGQPIKAKVFTLGHDQDSSWVFSLLPHGNYHRYLPAGTYQLVFSAPGYQTKTITGVGVVNGQKTTLDVALARDGYYLTGAVAYNNAMQTGLSGVMVYLSDSLGQTLDSILSETNGSFGFSGLPAGNYFVQARPSIAWGGVNSADALAILRHFVQLGSPLQGLSELASDVTASGYVNATDALMVQKRFVGLISTFALSDWVSELVQVNLHAHTQVLVLVQCAGDADQSHEPSVP